MDLRFRFLRGTKQTVCRTEASTSNKVRFAFRILKRRRLMGDEKSPIIMAARDRDRELLIPVADSSGDAAASSSSKPSSSSSSQHHHTGHEVISSSTQLGFWSEQSNPFVFFSCLLNLDCVEFVGLGENQLGMVQAEMIIYTWWGTIISFDFTACLSSCYVMSTKKLVCKIVNSA